MHSHRALQGEVTGRRLGTHKEGPAAVSVLADVSTIADSSLACCPPSPPSSPRHPCAPPAASQSCCTALRDRGFVASLDTLVAMEEAAPSARAVNVLKEMAPPMRLRLTHVQENCAQCGEGAGEGRKLLVCGKCSAVRYCSKVRFDRRCGVVRSWPHNRRCSVPAPSEHAPAISAATASALPNSGVPGPALEAGPQGSVQGRLRVHHRARFHCIALFSWILRPLTVLGPGACIA
jgi:hypothetical protein